MEDVLEIPNAGIDTGAETTPDESLPSPEVSTDNPPVAVPGEDQGALAPKPKEETGALPGATQQEKPNPWDKDQRFVEANRLRKEFETQLPVLQHLSERGIQSVEDADYLVNMTEDRLNLEKRFQEAPVELATEWRSTYPEAWAQVYGAVKSEVTPQVAKMALDELTQLAQSAGNQEALAFLQQQSIGNGNGRKPPGSAHGIEPERHALQTERQQFETERQETFLDSVASNVQNMVHQKIEPLIEGIKFVTEGQKALFFRSVAEDLEAAETQNWNLNRQKTALEKSRDSAGLMKVYEAHATTGNLLNRIVEARLKDLNATRAKAPAPGRREPGGAAGPGSVQSAAQTQHNTKLAELRKKHDAGEISDVDMMAGRLALGPG